MIIRRSIPSAIGLGLSISLSSIRLSCVSYWLDGASLDIDIVDVSSVLPDGLPDGVIDEPFWCADHFSSAEEG